jgi:putative oxidoreductase
MTVSSRLESLMSLGYRVATRVVQPVAPLITRLVIGQAFFLTGRGKLMNFDSTAGFFAGLGIPFPTANAAFISTLELVGGVCLMLGLGTRVFAALLSSTMVVALMTADKMSFVSALEGTSDQGLTGVVPVVFLMFLLWLVGSGPGPVSVDRIVARKLLPRVAPAPSY